ncbi:MAG: hypothetical protein ACJAS9_001506 [Polaribacter sp.]|jgi:hypothetical protein
MLDQNTTLSIEWIIKQDSLSEKSLQAWNELIHRSAFVTSTNSVEFNLNGLPLMKFSKPIYVLGYSSVAEQNSPSIKKLEVAFILVQKQKSFMGFKFTLLQTVSHDHVDMISILGTQYLNDAKCVASLKKALNKNLQSWSMLSARRLRSIEPIKQQLVSPTYSRESAYFILRDLNNNELEIKNIIPKKLYKNIARFERKIEKEQQGTLQLVSYTSKDDIDTGLSEFFKIEASGWKGKTGSAVQNDSQLETFYRNSWETLSVAGFAKVFVLTTDDKAIASAIAFQSKDEIILHKIAFDEELAQYGPGSILVKKIMEKVIDEEPVKSICFNTNPLWLKRWHAQCYNLVALQVFNSSLKGNIIRSLFKIIDTLRTIKRQIKKNDKQRKNK